MFLPVLLVRDYGIWGVVRSSSISARLLGSNIIASRAFSLVTVAFHVLFLLYLGGVAYNVSNPPGPWNAILFVVVAALAAWMRTRWLSVVVACASLALFAAFLWTNDSGEPWNWLVRSSGEERNAGLLLPIALVSVFGFVLCPYLDPTFHRARQSLGARSARMAFAIGFGVLFAAMILFTLAYSTLYAYPGGRLEPVAIMLGHMIVQSAFTVGLHLRPQLPGMRGGPPWIVMRGLVIFAIGAICLDQLFEAATLQGEPRLADPEFEAAYRMFMGFYGLVFPAYVWLCMIPTRDGNSGIDGPIGRRKLIVWALAVALAAPAFWMGFIEREEWWLAPGLAVVLLARLLIPGGAGFGPLPREPSGAPVPAPTRPPTLAAHARPGPGPGDA
jgi:hypothetical protein